MVEAMGIIASIICVNTAYKTYKHKPNKKLLQKLSI